MGKMMSSNFFIDYSPRVLNISYKFLGVRLTNFLVRNPAMVYTSGENIHSVLEDIQYLKVKNINALVGFTIEALPKMDEGLVDTYIEEIVTSIRAISQIRDPQGRSNGHQAIKFSAFITLDVMTRWSKAQSIFMEDILKFNKQEIDITDFRNSLTERGIKFT